VIDVVIRFNCYCVYEYTTRILYNQTYYEIFFKKFI
jgi:hypothetical protein